MCVESLGTRLWITSLFTCCPTLQFVVRGGIEVAAEFTYKMEPEVCIHFCKQYPGPRLKLKRCTTVYHSWPKNFAEIYAYYQRRKLSVS